MKNVKFKKLIIAALLMLCMGLPIAFEKNDYSKPNQTASATAEQQLAELPKKLYNHLKEKILLVSSGELESTKFVIESDTLDAWGAQRVWAGETLSSISGEFYEQFTISKVVYALLHDLPYELYWFDKTEGYSNSLTGTNSSSQATVKSLTINFRVTNEFKADSYDSKNPTVNTTKTQATASALTNAKSIVETYESLGDYQKLLAYKNKICELVEYDEVAVSPSYTGGYGSPWQMIAVFDNNTQTNVVCEGYAKAFQLLCDLSTFESPFVECFTVSGIMYGGTGAGNHMWNIVKMDDEKVYLADITNSDAGSTGWNGSLFIAEKIAGNINSGFSFEASTTISYTYNENTFTLWGHEETSVLNISATEYEINSPKIKISATESTYDAQSVVAGLAGGDGLNFGYEFEDDALLESNFNWSHEWFLNTNGSLGSALETAPKNAGNYWLQITATSKVDSNYKVIVTKNIKINPKTITVTGATCLDRTFNGTTIVSVSAATFDGVLNGDNVLISTETIANISSPAVGQYATVNLSSITLAGESKNNYMVQDSQENVTLSTNVEISKATLSCSEVFEKIKTSGTTLESFEMAVVAKGVSSQVISGTFVWIDENGEVLNTETEIEKDKTYHYKFTPADSNYAEFEGSVVIWESEKATDKKDDENLFDKLKNHELMKYAPYVLGAIVILIIVIVIAKKRKKSA